jgi:putative inorganic carbon (hco3(-)) transporter
MDSQDLSLSQSDGISQIEDIHTGNTAYSEIDLSAPSGKEERPPTFWRMRFIEAGMFISMALYYIVANPNIHIGSLHIPLQNLNPLYSLPFLLIFAILCWFRLPVAIALLPVSLPYYYIQKNVTQSARFSLVEITLYTCVAIALLQYITALIRHKKWRYQLSWSDLRDRFGPFLWPVVVFFLAALVSITIAYSRSNAERAFREEILGPLLYLVLAFLCLRSRQDITRLVLALLGSGLLIALLGCIQYFVFRNTITPDVDGIRRITTVYGSGNNIGVFFDYTLPIGFALLLSCFAWKWRLIALLCCIPFAFVLYQSGSRGSLLLAMPVALLFVIAFAIRNRRVLLISSIAFVIVCAIVGGIYSQEIISFVIYGHTSSQGDSTALKRPLLWLTALNMIHDSPWLGYGMDNWLCHYSDSWENTCLYPKGFPPGAKWNNGISTNPPLHAYWIIKDANGNLTGMNDEPDLSHPHNIFLHVWVSIGIFGLLAFIASIVLFYWIFARLLRYLTTAHPPEYELLRLLLVSIGAAMLAALVQGQVDSSFLEQDLAFCFWTLVAALLLLRAIIGMPWRFLVRKS